MADAAIHFYFDPVCPFAWMTSKWVRLITAQRDYDVDWRFISLRMVNAAVDYDTHFPPGDQLGHTGGLKLLRVAARVRADLGRDQIGPLYLALGTEIFDTCLTGTETGAPSSSSSQSSLASVSRRHSPRHSMTPPSTPSFGAKTYEALALTGKDVGTPIIQFQLPEGVAFFGPVISRLPDSADAVRLWDHVIGLASFPGFAELKRSLRELPRLASFGIDPDEVGIQEDWHGGSRRTKK